MSRKDAGYSEVAAEILNVALPGAIAALNANQIPDDLRVAFGLINEALPERVEIVVLTTGVRWLVFAMPKVDPQNSNRTTFGAQYSIVADGAGRFHVTEDWRDISYPTGQGNFPLWISEGLQNCFRLLLGQFVALSPAQGWQVHVADGVLPFENSLPFCECNDGTDHGSNVFQRLRRVSS